MLKKLFDETIYILFFIFFVGCSTQLKYEMNSVKFLSPEAKGKFLKGDFGLSYQLNNDVILTESFDPLIFNLPTTVTDKNTIEKGSNFSFPLNLGLLEKIDFYTIDRKGGFKFQFWGTSFEQKAPGLKAALAIGYGHDTPSSETVTYSSNNSLRVYNTKGSIISYEYGMLVGHRFTEENLLYSHFFYDDYRYDCELSSNQFSTLNTKGKSSTLGLILGFERSTKEDLGPMIKAEVSLVKASLRGFQSKYLASAGTSISYYW